MAGSAATLKIEYGPAEYGAELADFAAAAFEPKDGHRGRHIIERRRAGGWEFETVATCYIDELPAVLSALEIEPDALTAIAKKALEQKTGARGLRAILEGVLMQTMFDAPSKTAVRKVVIKADNVENGTAPTLLDENGNEIPAA